LRLLFFIDFFFFIFFFFFFQAEDGIRDLIVTGVQTCALPISLRPPARRSAAPRTPSSVRTARRAGRRARSAAPASGSARPRRRRSEERRVGKECRSRWSPEH